MYYIKYYTKQLLGQNVICYITFYIHSVTWIFINASVYCFYCLPISTGPLDVKIFRRTSLALYYRLTPPPPTPITHLYACPIPWPKLYQVLSTFLFLWYLSMEVVRCCWPFLCLARLRWMDGSCLLVPVTVLSFVFCIQQIIEHSNSSNPYPSELNKHRKNVYISYIPIVAWNRRRCFIYGHSYT